MFSIDFSTTSVHDSSLGFHGVQQRRAETSNIVRLNKLMMISAKIFTIIFAFISQVYPSDALVTYSEARNVRAKLGHEASVDLYKELLELNADDISATIRIASARSSPTRHDLACPGVQKAKVQLQVNELRTILERSSYTHIHIQRIFGVRPFSEMDFNNSEEDITKNEALGSTYGPIYIKPVTVGSKRKDLDRLLCSENEDSSLKCLVAMFILGLSVPIEILSSKLVGGKDTVFLLEKLGLAFPCETDPSIIVPYVHIFPMDIPDPSDYEMKRTLTLVTDLHPSVISTTSLGEFNDGAVMYIGPDSLALVQHLPLNLYINVRDNGEICSDSLQILDFCTGSGVQALSVLKALEVSNPDSYATCVDLNDRALRFTRFNAILNGISLDRIKCVKADLLSGKSLQSRYTSLVRADGIPLNDILMKNSYDIITANPPFIPVPDNTDRSTNDELISGISKRYGLFSSGGSSGEEVLQKIVQMAPLLLREKHGLLAIVSEFMNPPNENNCDKSLIEKIMYWWQSSLTKSLSAVGVLFTNQFPVSDEIYASRRADDEAERNVWTTHLNQYHIKSVSPGLLYIQSGLEEGSQNLYMESKLVPQSSKLGSIWTPYNFKAIEFTKTRWKERTSKCDKTKAV